MASRKCCGACGAMLAQHNRLSKLAQRLPGEQGCLTKFLQQNLALVVPSADINTVLPFGCCPHAEPGQCRN